MSTGLLERQEVTMELVKVIPRAEPLAPAGPSCPPEFRGYLLNGDHWRVGKRVRGERARFNGFALHRSGGGSDGQEGAMQFDGTFLEYLEQSIVDGRVEKAFRTAATRHAWIEDAIRELDACKDLADDMKCMRYYLPPLGRRGLSVIQMATEMKCSTDALRDAAYRGVRYVWDEIGGVW